MDTKKLRQKILDLAIRGKLVPQDPNDEPASVLLERIKAEKEQLIKDGKIKRSKKSASSDTSPYYERNIKCFEQLLDHQKQEVREWAQKCINNEKKLLDMEKDEEDFRKIRHGM